MVRGSQHSCYGALLLATGACACPWQITTVSPPWNLLTRMCNARHCLHFHNLGNWGSETGKLPPKGQQLVKAELGERGLVLWRSG